MATKESVSDSPFKNGRKLLFQTCFGISFIKHHPDFER